MTALMDDVARVQRGHPSPFIGAEPPRVNVNSVMELIYRLDLARAVRHINPRPLLLVHCEGDEWVPVHVSQRLYQEALEPKALWLLPGGNHHFAQHDPVTDARIIDWIGMVAE